MLARDERDQKEGRMTSSLAEEAIGQRARDVPEAGGEGFDG